MGDQSHMSGYGSVSDISAELKTASGHELERLIERYAADPRTGVRSAVAKARKRAEKHARLVAETREKYRLMRELGGDGVVVGVDEVGRGAVAGPLTVAAVCLPEEPLVLGLNDSKQLTPERRVELARQIRACAAGIGIAHIPPEVIDEQGMASCLRQAMAEAVENTGLDPDAVLIDGNPVHAHPKERCIVKGDAKIACIAAASIVAKVTRDELMVAADAEFPGYHLAQSKGYASPDHIAAIRRMGLSEFHRRSFCQGFLDNQPSLF